MKMLTIKNEILYNHDKSVLHGTIVWGPNIKKKLS